MARCATTGWLPFLVGNSVPGTALVVRLPAELLDQSVQGRHFELHGIRDRVDVDHGDFQHSGTRAAVRCLRNADRGSVATGFKHELDLAATGDGRLHRT